MDTITTQEELEEILLDESISYPRCFASLKEVFKDIQGSLLSLLDASKCRLRRTSRNR